jgi:hypothetical protein
MRLRLMLPTAILMLLVGTHAFAGPVVVACAPGQRAIVRDTVVRGQAVTRVECASASTYRQAAYRTQYVRRYRDGHSRRSWGKSALIIGGSAASGAGIGGIIHGQKGALIGGALGGGVASLYEGAHRR